MLLLLGDLVTENIEIRLYIEQNPFPDPNASSSLSLPSGSCRLLAQPPDVGNWFSSYEYKSPSPDSNVNFEDCESEKDEERNKLLISSGSCFEDEKHNEDLPLAKDVDSSCSVLLSEPPDIRNWFSSYVYESPVSGISTLLGDSVSEETECEDKCFNVEAENEHEVVPPRESIFTHNTSSGTNTRVKLPSSKGDGSVEMKENIGFANTSHLGKIVQPCMQDKTTLQHNVSPTKCDHKSVIKEAMIQHENGGSSISGANRISEGNSTCLREKENGEDMMAMNGFVTTKKSRQSGAKEENYGDSRNRRRVSLTCKKEGDMKRKALEEITNVKGMEVRGKWRCPQKSKPIVGPALKQLRLEQWVHKQFAP
ncbi:choline transporter-like protein 2 [Senna tora]|uniref:Choline transporter-like protein 2 n=1 Tax=Senna tora TaxID=362788 RepID=A0A834TTS4_9FABA|nr:choline transporter-like protein 2 [Senna tora]